MTNARCCRAFSVLIKLRSADHGVADPLPPLGVAEADEVNRGLGTLLAIARWIAV